MNLFLLGFIAQLLLLYGMILFSEYLRPAGFGRTLLRAKHMATILIFIAFICKDHAAAAADVTRASVIAMRVELQEVADRMLYPARIAAYRSVSVPAEIEGFVQTLDVALGQQVRSGQILVRISNPDPVYEFKSYGIKAPFAGVVSSIDVAMGDRITRGKNLLTLADSASLKILVHLTTDDVKKLKPGYPGSLLIDKQAIPVRIRAMSPVIDATTGTAPCELELSDAPKSAGLLVAGSIGQVRFSVNQRKAVLLPERSIVYRGKDPYIIRLTKDLKAEYLTVTIVRQSSGQVEIESALKAGETIVASSQGFVAEGEAVTVESTQGG
ncbi:MAG: efflux RND transporter periplasmic adaptor subunit [Pseudobdellovibrionaceae bacterium]|nr:efflux RND transporter periplasmic adaptor subunit [Pseudobdellovibrionaceae bacterium]